MKEKPCFTSWCERSLKLKKMFKWVCKTVECWEVQYKNSVCFEDVLHTECKGSAILEVKEELHSARFQGVTEILNVKALLYSSNKQKNVMLLAKCTRVL